MMAPENLNITFLLQQLQQSSEEAFSKIYDHFSRPMHRKILRLVKNEDIADELLQELFLHIWIQRKQIVPEKPFWPYLHTVSNWLTLNHFRKVSQDKRLMGNLLVVAVDYIMDVEESIINQETHALLMKAIEHLPPQRKEVFRLCKFEGKSYQEVGEILGISTATIRNQIVAANKSVKEFFLLNHELALLFILSTLGYLITKNKFLL